MLTEKDFCDYETCVALKEMGYKGISRFFYATKESPLRRYSYDQILTTRIANAVGHTLAISLYVAQKWLREEKGIHISIDYDEFEWSYCLFDCSKKHYKQLSNCRMYFKSYEEALLNGIKVSVDFLKEK